MKRTIIIAIAIAVVIACKKEKQFCYWAAKSGTTVVEFWLHDPTTTELQETKDSCACQIQVEKICQPCNGTITDPNGNDIACE
jgi:hypothetical protein